MKARVLFGQIRRSGIRLHGGPWTVAGVADNPGRIIVALGRTAGSAVVRSRMRRIARDIFRRSASGKAGTSSVLLMARASVAREPRRIVRAKLADLFDRLDRAIEKRGRGSDNVAG